MIKKVLFSAIVASIVAGCAGSPVRMSGQSVNEIIGDLNLDKVSLRELCQKKTYFIGRLLRNVKDQPTWDHSGLKQGIRAVDVELIRRGYDKRYCEGGSYAYKKTPTQAAQPRSSAQTNSPQSPAKLEMGEIDSSVNIDQKVRIGLSRMEAVRSIGNPFEITRIAGVVATSYCQTNAVQDRFITLWFKNGGLTEIESKLEYRGTGNCTEFISKPSEDDIPQKLGRKSVKGTRTYSNGVTYSGQFIDGIFHGLGEMTYENGNKFVGQYVNGWSEGKGQTFNSKGDLIFEGHYKKGKPHGIGISYPVGKRPWSATWKDGKVIMETFKWLDEQ